jgi:hypothetical protein
MLRFQSRPDRVFGEILHAALEFKDDEIDMHIEGSGEDPKEWAEWFPDLAKFFSPRLARDTIGRILAASRDARIHQLTDYHWYIVYHCLNYFCDVHNDLAREGKTGTCSVAPCEIGQIDFDYIVDHFFWDTDFLAAEHLLDLTTQHRQRVGFSDEAWSLAAGLRPHPDELAIQIWEDEAGWDAEPDEYPSSGTISSYPRE